MDWKEVTIEYKGRKTLPLICVPFVSKGGLKSGRTKGTICIEPPLYEAPPFQYSRECLNAVSRDVGVAHEAVRSLSGHSAKFMHYLQFEDDESCELVGRLKSHIELVVAIFETRLSIDPQPLWDEFLWLRDFQWLQADYRADADLNSTYDVYVEKLDRLMQRHSRDFTRSIDRGERQISINANVWCNLPLIHLHDLVASAEQLEGVKLFYCYSHADENLRDELERHLSILRRRGDIAHWHDRRIGPGRDWNGEIDDQLKASHIILLLISADFLDSDYCYDVEFKVAIERHRRGEARVVPVFLRPCDWHGAPFASLQGLPTDALPVTTWANRDEAFTCVAKGIRSVVDEIRKNRS